MERPSAPRGAPMRAWKMSIGWRYKVLRNFKFRLIPAFLELEAIPTEAFGAQVNRSDCWNVRVSTASGPYCSRA